MSWRVISEEAEMTYLWYKMRIGNWACRCITKGKYSTYLLIQWFFFPPLQLHILYTTSSLLLLLLIIIIILTRAYEALTIGFHLSHFASFTSPRQVARHNPSMAIPSFLKYAFVWILPLVSAGTWLGQSERNHNSMCPSIWTRLLK